MHRRQLIKGGVSLGALATAGIYGWRTLLPPPRSAELASVQDLACRLFDSLSSELRERACVDYDHPLRQYHNRGVDGGGLDIDLGTFSREQRSLLTDLLYAGLSEAGRERLPKQFFIGWPGVHIMRLLVCGDPHDEHFQIVLSGPHVNLRLGGKSREGVAFGGPQVYGDQRGDAQEGLPGNVYRYQFLLAKRLFDELEPGQQDAALFPLAPIQTQIELQGSRGSFSGIEVANLSKANKVLAHELVGGILSTYAPDDVAYANLCIAENGGVERLFLSYYEKAGDGGGGPAQIFRLEGPAAVFHFRGYPHLHAFVNVAMDGDRPLSVGEIVGENPVVLEGDRLKRLYEDAMKDHAGADFALYPMGAVVGRLRAGSIRTGDVYTCESWQNSVATATIRGADIGGLLREELRESGIDLDAERAYTVATTSYAANHEAADTVGQAGAWVRGTKIRDATVAYLKEHGFPRGA